MKTPWTLALVAGALTVAGEELTLKATKEVAIERTFHHEASISLEAMAMFMNGEEQPGPPGEMEQEISTVLDLTVRDVVLEVEGDRVVALERSFLEIKSSRSMHLVDPMGGGGDHSTVEKSGLEQKTVEFRVDGDETSTSWAKGSEGDPELLESLEMSMDLGVVLPEGKVEEGDSWEISTSLLAALGSPGGDLHLEPTDESTDGFGAPPEGFDPPEPEYYGEIEGTFRGVRDDDGRRVGAVELSIDASAFVDLSEMADSQTEEMPEDAPPGAVMPEVDSIEREIQYKGEGLLLWDLEAGRLLSLEIQCDVRHTETVNMILDMGGEEMEMEQVMELSGTESWEVRFDG